MAGRLKVWNAATGTWDYVSNPTAPGSGTAFPASPVTGDRFFRTDIGMEFYWDGTRWLSSEVFTGHFTNQPSALPFTATSGTAWAPVFVTPGSDIWLLGHASQFYVSGGTALSASHKWVGAFDRRDSANIATLIATTNINSGASSVWRTDIQNINALLGSAAFVFSNSWTKTGTPGDLYVTEYWTYRIVAV